MDTYGDEDQANWPDRDDPEIPDELYKHVSQYSRTAHRCDCEENHDG